MLRSNFARRAGRLLGAVTVGGVLAAGLLAASPVAADGAVRVGSSHSSHSRGIVFNEANGLSVGFGCANGL